MCYSAQIKAEYEKYRRLTGADMDIRTFVRTFWWKEGAQPSRRPRVPRAVERDLLANGPEEVAVLVRRWDAWETDRLTREVFAQRRRVADAERALQARDTKKAREDARIGSAKVAAAQRRLDALKGREGEDDRRIYPGSWCPVVVAEGGRRLVRLMRYQCRPAGKPASFDRRFPGTYSARRDSLEGFWAGLFGRRHAVMIADRFYENVEVDGRNRVLEFAPRTGEPMYIACLWSEWTDPAGREPDLLSFAAITDDPEPEVAAAGHDRTIINLKPEHLDAWLDPDPRDLARLYAILDDRQHPYYEHRIAA
ncbi:putative SOS response-associated peptidase YedK [Luteimonas sp. J16]|uniref:SOS response-associated peptidase family protein n=1 Tax=unclassified Luteimonas TaxID=2629088 RepID=UPI00047E1BA5|nr:MULTISPECIES: SOS response-associated peptidase family protein [unclassified Luteimonas]TWG92852.1 putative SOS response-associated peptidase YedK [Luteimonas sp. J16]